MLRAVATWDSAQTLRGRHARLCKRLPLPRGELRAIPCEGSAHRRRSARPLRLSPPHRLCSGSRAATRAPSAPASVGPLRRLPRRIPRGLSARSRAASRVPSARVVSQHLACRPRDFSRTANIRIGLGGRLLARNRLQSARGPTLASVQRFVARLAPGLAHLGTRGSRAPWYARVSLGVRTGPRTGALHFSPRGFASPSARARGLPGEGANGAREEEENFFFLSTVGDDGRPVAPRQSRGDRPTERVAAPQVRTAKSFAPRNVSWPASDDRSANPKHGCGSEKVSANVRPRSRSVGRGPRDCRVATRSLAR